MAAVKGTPAKRWLVSWRKAPCEAWSYSEIGGHHLREFVRLPITGQAFLRDCIAVRRKHCR